MAYTITYDQSELRIKTVQSRSRPSKKMVTAFVCAIVILIVWMITPVRVAVLDFLLPGDGDVTRRASEQFLNDIKSGQPVKEAFNDFCIEIVEHA